MKKLLLYLVTGILFLSASTVTSQVGIGTDVPNPSSQLEIKSANRGVLIPQIPLTDLGDQSTINAGNVESLLVYNTNTATNLTPGYYYWFEGTWKRLLTENDLPENIVFWDVANGQFTYIDANGDVQIIDIADLETLTSIAMNADGKTLEYTDEDGVVTQIDLETVIKNFETLTTIVANTDGTFTYTDENGDTTIIDMSALETLTVLALNADGKTLEYTDEAGTTITIDLATVIQDFETITTLIDNGDGTFTYTNEAGTITNISFLNTETLTILALNPNGKTLEYTDENGDVTSIDLETVIKNFETITTLVDNLDGTFTYTNEDGVTTDITVSSIETLTTLALNVDGKTLEYTDENGVVTSLDLEAIIKNFETITTLIDNQDGTFTYTNENGDATIISVSTMETLTILALNADGQTLEYTDENGDVTSIDLGTVIAGFETLADNGLTKTNDIIQLGGPLVQPTVITTTDTNTLAVTGLEDGAVTDLLVVTDAAGILKQVKAALPKFFYMPAITFDTSANGTFTRDLHAEYVAQFQGTGNPLLVSSAGSTNGIPTLPASELEYYITYYDTDVFANLSISATGVLTYDIIAGATPASYMNIVFVVK